jgi:hypothetical protein
VFFFELREGDNDIFADLILVHEEPMEPDEFFELVQSIRRSLSGGFEHETLIEAIAAELERDYGFVAITDDRLLASVNVSANEDDNYLAELDDDEDEDEADYRGLFIDLPNQGGRPH